MELLVRLALRPRWIDYGLLFLSLRGFFGGLGGVVLDGPDGGVGGPLRMNEGGQLNEWTAE